MSDNIILATIKYIAIEIVWDVVYFPIWWYTKGLARVARYCLDSATTQIKHRLALGVWISSIAKPMYGDYTIEGRIISGMMRLVVLVWKLILMFLWLIVLFVLFFAWIILPILVIYYILYQLFDIPLFFIT
jgi:hypothetical protein